MLICETLIYTADIPEDNMAHHLNPKENVSKEDISNFFIDELRKIRFTLK